MAQKRAKKKGFTYLLQCAINDLAFKFGATTVGAEQRCRAINNECKRKGMQYQFKVIRNVQSKDCFGLENKMKWHLLDGGAGALGEMFVLDDNDSISDLVARFDKLSGVIPTESDA